MADAPQTTPNADIVRLVEGQAGGVWVLVRADVARLAGMEAGDRVETVPTTAGIMVRKA